MLVCASLLLASLGLGEGVFSFCLVFQISNLRRGCFIDISLVCIDLSKKEVVLSFVNGRIIVFHWFYKLFDKLAIYFHHASKDDKPY